MQVAQLIFPDAFRNLKVKHLHQSDAFFVKCIKLFFLPIQQTFSKPHIAFTGNQL